MKPSLTHGFLVLLALSICLKAAKVRGASSSHSDDDDRYHYEAEDGEDQYDDEYDDTYDEDPAAAVGGSGPPNSAGHDSDKWRHGSSSSTTSSTTTTTRAPPPWVKTTEAPPLWSDEDDVREFYSCPEPCFCEDGTKFVNCSHRSLTEIPENLPRNVIRLDLSSNNIKHVPVEAFQNCTDIREIRLDHNVVEDLDKEVFLKLDRLDVLTLAENQLSHLAVDSFAAAPSLRRIVLSENPLVLPDEGPFLEQEELEELELARCNLTELSHQTFLGLTNLKWLDLAGNEFDEDLSTEVFEPLANLQRLHLPPLSEDTVRDLCDVVKSIDVVDITTHNISCFYLASETSYEESIITQRPITPEPPPKVEEPEKERLKPTKQQVNKGQLREEQEAGGSTEAPPRISTKNSLKIGSSSSTTTSSPIVSGPSSASITHSSDDNSKDEVRKEVQPGSVANGDESFLASLSSETMKQLLMGIIGAGVLILLIGIICRRTGLKNRFCGSKRRPASTDQVRPAEEVPLNKV
ncbi:uncharacterized protein LOC129744187 [Uranotaenia lowii]|uniref:uncharacterized protein LOC129744187 n=1 Tax=Uranotaenia lowii TaxID=190385 RepID=UPI002479AE99|nr:uncharacterized protein LOC129744187 [Uranotaenia lowii]XP_055592575.1 uncharacterized protein LOC129744187 [Uranotaenia lowii]